MENHTQAAQSGNGTASSDETRILRSADLFAGQRVLIIEHAGQRYRLLITRNERLILQK